MRCLEHPDSNSWFGYECQVVLEFCTVEGLVGLPQWVLKLGESDPDIFFRDQYGNVLHDCLSLSVDHGGSLSSPASRKPTPAPSPLQHRSLNETPAPSLGCTWGPPMGTSEYVTIPCWATLLAVLTWARSCPLFPHPFL